MKKLIKNKAKTNYYFKFKKFFDINNTYTVFFTYIIRLK